MFFKEERNWGDGGPSNAEVETAISEILRSVDLVHCTMKQMCDRVKISIVMVSKTV